MRQLRLALNSTAGGNGTPCLCKHCERPHMKCPACRGVWLDRGELDKLLDRAAAAVTPAPERVVQSRKQFDLGDSDYRGDQRYHHQRKKSWLNEIFD